ncbi:MAG: hypothetical protein ABIF19_08265, partial [Planctomycetota bacterium]
MKKAKVVSAIVLSVVLVAAILAVSAHAGKPPSPPGLSKTVVISVSGAIEGSGTDAANMAISFDGQSFVDEGVAGSYVANPDGRLRVSGVRRGSQTLRYYYCDHESHEPGDDTCAETSDYDHDPYSYKCLIIKNGALEGKKETEQIVFQDGSPWEIWRNS